MNKFGDISYFYHLVLTGKNNPMYLNKGEYHTLTLCAGEKKKIIK